MSKKGGKDGGGSMDKEKELGKLYKELGALRCSPKSHYRIFPIQKFTFLEFAKGQRRILTLSRRIGKKQSR